MKCEDVFDFLLQKRLAVISTAHPSGTPESALIGFAITPDLGFVFDTSSTSRKAMNLKARPEAALVIGWDDEITVQVEGVAHQPQGAELDAAKAAYFTVWPLGRDRESWPDIVYFVVSPRWLRYSSFATGPEIAEFSFGRQVGS